MSASLSTKSIRYRVVQFVIILGLCLCLTKISEAASSNTTFLTIADPAPVAEGKGNKPLAVIVSEVHEGVSVTISYINKSDPSQMVEETPDSREVPSGGEVTCHLDDIQIFNQLFTGEEFRETNTLDPGILTNGPHLLRCEAKSYPGGQQAQAIKFTIDATPVIDINEDNPGHEIDPHVSLRMFGEHNGKSGYLEAFIDDDLAGETYISKENVNKPMRLSELLESSYQYQKILLQGVHLLRIEATAINGSKRVAYKTYKISTEPIITIENDAAGKFKAILISYPKYTSGTFGDIDIYFRNVHIYSHELPDDHFTVSRTEIEEVLKKNNQSIGQDTESLIVAVRARNGSEHWSKVEFR